MTDGARWTDGSPVRRSAGPPDPTVADLLAEGERVLAGAGVADARREALTLFAAVAETSPGGLWTRRTEPAASDVAEAFLRAVAQRAAGVGAALPPGPP